jgi:glycosyltransferase involved in cell wall biosynthesis
MRIAVNGMLLGELRSGVEISILGLARALAQFGREDYVFYVPRNAPGPDLAGPRFRTLRIGIPTRSRPLRIAWEQAALPRRLIRDGVAVLHAPGYVAPAAARVPVVATVYDAIALTHPEWCTALNRLHYRLLVPLTVRRARFVAVPSEATRAALVDRLGIGPAKIRIVPLGVDERFAPIHDAARLAQVRQKYALPPRFILFAGRQDPRKNLERLIESFAALKAAGLPHDLVLAGRDGRGTAAVRAAVRRLGLAGSVRFPGFVPTEDLAGLYNTAELFVFPSLYEGFGLPPIESMACGVPVVTSRGGAIPEVVGDAAQLVDPTDGAALARAVLEALNNGDLRRRLAAAGLERAARFTWRRAAEAMDRCYREAAGAT